MKILSLSTKDHKGGAYIAAYRQLKAFQEAGVSVKMLVLDSFRKSEVGILPEKNWFFKQWNKLTTRVDSLPKVFTSPRKDTFLAWVPNRTVQRAKKIKSDIVQVHSFTDGLLRIEDLTRLGKNDKPVVWTLHDSWGMVGAEHLPKKGDNRYVVGYQNRPRGERGPDLNAWVFTRKQKAFAQISNLTIVCPSNWLFKKAKQSLLFKDRRIELIGNPLNMQIFSPQNKEKSRQSLGLPQNKILIGFGALAGSDNKNKGFDLLIKSLKELAKKYSPEQIELVVFGDQKNDLSLPFKANSLGQIWDEKKLASVYSSLDVVVVPSRLENLPYAAMEAMACGTPVVGFDTSGMPDLIPKDLLARQFNAKDLAQKIQLVLEGDGAKLGRVVRQKVLKNFDSNLIAQKYLNLYNDLINN